MIINNYISGEKLGGYLVVPLLKFFCSTHLIIPGAIYSCVKFNKTSRVAVKTQNNKTLLQFL